MGEAFGKTKGGRYETKRKLESINYLAEGRNMDFSANRHRYLFSLEREEGRGGPDLACTDE